jgi:hypothetical protein
MKKQAWLLGAALISFNTLAAGPGPYDAAGDAAVLRFKTWDGKDEVSRFSVIAPGASLRTYTQSTTLRLRDPGPQQVSYSESADLPRIRSGNLAFDALFALALAEMKQDSVHEIRDGSYNGGAPIPCECFETGEKWHYVWTRDLSYAADLGLALLDPQRVRNSLQFKLSAFRADAPRAGHVAGNGDMLQIVQDTGSGGSWPVSTDRVTWAFAAEQVLATLPGAQRPAFARTALEALSNTIENDRLAAFDHATGLYTGEESFLDWREQSYASWIPDKLSSMATSMALSTNVAHYKALTLAARLAREQGDAPRAGRYQGWAVDLKAAINHRLWLEDEGMYSSLTAGHFDGAPMHKFDWLGQSLAIVTGVADPARSRRILASYPHGPMGAPVIWPQQQGVPVYHNRAIWPFVTAYGLRAAARAGNVSVADAAYETLVRAAALNMSNMENLEWLSGQPLLADQQRPSLAGPVINSRRQLWSVGAYIGMVTGSVFGVSANEDGIAIRPFVTSRLRRETFASSSQIVLDNLSLRGKRLAITIRLPPAGEREGYYTVERLLLNGADAGQAIAWDQLGDDNAIVVRLGALEPGQREIRRVSADPYAQPGAVFAPREPAIASLVRDSRGGARLQIESGGNGSDVRYNVYRDGKLAARAIEAGAWTDHTGSVASCYAVEAQFTDSGNRSHHSVPRCVDAGVEIAANDPRVASTSPVSADGRHLPGWGAAGDRFHVSAIKVDKAGNYAVQVRYRNGANEINLGISGGVKWLALKDARGKVVAQGVIQLPHTPVGKPAAAVAYSTPLPARLARGSYSLELTDFYNMSYLRSNSTFGAAGGADGPHNRFDIYGVRLLRVH